MVRRSGQRKHRAREINNNVRKLIETEKGEGKEGAAIKAAKEREKKKARNYRTMDKL